MRFKKAAAIFTMVGACSLGVANVSFAANTPVSGNAEVKFDKYLVMEEQANVPTADPQFTIAAGTSIDANLTAKTPAVLAGISPDAITITIDDFAPGDTTYTTAQEGDTVTLVEGQKYAVKEATVDMSGVSFTAPGVYRYIITETAPTETGITIKDNENTRTLDVYVESDNAGALSITGYVLHKGTDIKAVDVADADKAYSDKDVGFTNVYDTNNVVLSKSVTGNQGDRNKYFKFDVAISNAVKGTVYTVDLADAEASVTVDGTAKTNAAQLIVGDDGTVSATYYLKDSQNIDILGLVSGTKYTFTEDIQDAEGYTVSHVVTVGETAGESVSAKATGDKTMADADQAVAYTNYRNGVVPTGIFGTGFPYGLVAGGAAFVAAVMAFLGLGMKSSKKKSLEAKGAGENADK